uniref:Uncharacterized protein n=1 Tax=Plectus sambesii TaxID=2011161 RepID=A0A914V5U5_9BILA
DKVLTRAECDALLQLETLAELGDGYNGQASPHTDHETFRGLSIGRVATLAEQRAIPVETAKLMIDKTELAREFVQAYFNLTTTLFFDYTHLACRSANE